MMVARADAIDSPLLICSSHTVTGVAAGQVPRHSFDDRVAAVAEAGFDALAIHFRDHCRLLDQGADPGALRATVERAGLLVPEVEFLGDWHPWGAGAQASARAAIDTARLFGAGRINVGADLAGLGVPVETMTEPFRALCDSAGEAGLTVSLELLAWGSVRGLDDGLHLLAAAQGNAGLLIDIWHVMRGGCVASKDLQALDPALVAGIQINDAGPMMGDDLVQDTMNREFPGDGQFDLTAFLTALWPAARRTGISVEVMSQRLHTMPLAAICAKAVRTGRAAIHAAQQRVATDD